MVSASTSGPRTRWCATRAAGWCWTSRRSWWCAPSEAGSRRVRPLLVGHEARDLLGRCPVGLAAVRPLHDGVIVDLEAARAFMVALLGKVATPRWQRVRPRAVIGVPAGATALERRALLEVADEAGIRKPELIPEPIAGALGCGLDPLEPRAHMVLDIGGGTSEITAFCYGGVLSHRSSRIAGDEMTLTLYRLPALRAPAARRRADRGGAEVRGGRRGGPVLGGAGHRPGHRTAATEDHRVGGGPRRAAAHRGRDHRRARRRARRPAAAGGGRHPHATGSRSSAARACCAASTSSSSRRSPSRSGWPSGR